MPQGPDLVRGSGAPCGSSLHTRVVSPHSHIYAAERPEKYEGAALRAIRGPRSTACLVAAGRRHLHRAEKTPFREPGGCHGMFGGWRVSRTSPYRRPQDARSLLSLTVFFEPVGGRRRVGGHDGGSRFVQRVERLPDTARRLLQRERDGRQHGLLRVEHRVRARGLRVSAPVRQGRTSRGRRRRRYRLRLAEASVGRTGWYVLLQGVAQVHDLEGLERREQGAAGLSRIRVTSGAPW